MWIWYPRLSPASCSTSSLSFSTLSSQRNSRRWIIFRLWFFFFFVVLICLIIIIFFFFFLFFLFCFVCVFVFGFFRNNKNLFFSSLSFLFVFTSPSPIGIEHIHRCGTVHTDLSPANIGVTFTRDEGYIPKARKLIILFMM